MHRYLVAILMAGSATAALAQGADALTRANAPTRAEPAGDVIIVTAARTQLPASALPLTVDLIGAESLAQQASISGSVVDAVATLTPSFSPTRQKLSGAGETLRGRAPLFAINGIPQTSPLRDGSRDGFTIDPFFIDRVELIYGSNALQGIGATGGIVNQVTVGAPTKDGLSGRALAQATFDNDVTGAGTGWKTAALLAYRGGRFDATIGGAYEKRGVYRDGDGRILGFDGTQGETQDSKSWSLFGRFGYALSDSARIDLIASRFTIDGDGDYVTVNGDRLTGLPTSGVRGVQPGIPATGRVETLSLTITDNNLAGGNLVTQIFFNRTRDTFGGGIFPDFQDILITPSSTLFDQSQNRSRKYGGKASYERAVPGFEALTMTLGFDALYDRTTQLLIATGRAWVPQTDYRSLAPFGQANLKLFDGKLRLAGGVRYEDVEIKIPDFTTLAFYGRQAVAGGAPRFSDALINGGMIIEPVPGIRAYASYAEGYTVPDVGRITRAINVAGVDIDDYLNIRPIVSNNREIGVEVKRGPLDASASCFWSKSIEGQLLVLVNDVYEVQRQRIEIEGLELNLGVQTPVRGLKLNIGYAHLNGRTDSNNDGKVDIDLDGANISPDRLNLAASYARGPFSARVQGQVYLSRRFAGTDARNAFEGYTLVDGYARYQTPLGGVSLAVANLFDKQYISYNSDTTRPTDNTRFFAGRGRSFTIGWDYRF
jgi:iron complex outermembrane receptor protein